MTTTRTVDTRVKARWMDQATQLFQRGVDRQGYVADGYIPALKRMQYLNCSLLEALEDSEAIEKRHDDFFAAIYYPLEKRGVFRGRGGELRFEVYACAADMWRTAQLLDACEGGDAARQAISALVSPIFAYVSTFLATAGCHEAASSLLAFAPPMDGVRKSVDDLRVARAAFTALLG